jgi:signal transduction histidine kinase
MLILAVVREQAMARRLFELKQSVERVSREWTGPSSLVEEHEDNPIIEFAVSSQDGTLLASTSKRSISFVAGQSSAEHRLNFGLDKGQIRVMGTTSLLETEAGIRQLGIVLAWLWLPLVVLTALVAWYGGGLVLRPVSELIRSADQLSSGQNCRFLETSDHAEFANLTSSLNLMIARIRKAAEIQEQFASDAAHELRSPLALLRTRVETTLLNERNEAEYRDSLRSMLVQIDRLTSIVETLLTSTRQSILTTKNNLKLDTAVSKITDSWVLESDWQIERIEVTCEPSVTNVTFEELRIILGNLLDNASRYAPSDTSILVDLKNDGEFAYISIRDFGCGLKPNQQERAFDRLYRADSDRNRDYGGAGIGLAVVKRLVEKNGGQVGFSTVTPGTQVWFSLPTSVSQRSESQKMSQV